MTIHGARGTDAEVRHRLAFGLRDVRWNGRSLTREEIEYFDFLLQSGDRLEFECELHEIKDSSDRYAPNIPIPPGEYQIGASVSVSSRPLDQDWSLALWADDELRSVIVDFQAPKLPPDDEQAFIECLRLEEGDAEEQAAMAARLAAHPTEALVPLFTALLASADQPAAVKRAALHGIWKVRRAQGRDLYRQYAADPAQPLALRQDAFLLVAEFGTKEEDDPLFQQIEQEGRQELSDAISTGEQILQMRWWRANRVSK